MKKYSSTNKLLIKYIIKILLSTAVSLLLFTFLFSEITYKLDLSFDNNYIFSIIIVFLCSAASAYISVLSIKNNGALMGIIATLPLVFFQLVNTIINKQSFILFLIKIIITVLTGALFGILATKKTTKFKVK